MVVQEVKEAYDSDYNSYNTIKLEDKYLTLPCKFHLLKDLGYELKSRDSELILKPMTFYTMLYAYNEQGDKVVIDVVNNSDKEQSIEDCDIYELSAEVNKDNTTSISMKLKELSFFSDVKKAESIFGSDYYMSDVYDNVQTAAWHTEKYDRDIMLTYEKGTGLIAIKVSVELPEGVEYSSATVGEDYESYNIGDDKELYTSKENQRKKEELKSITKGVITWSIIGIVILIIIVVSIVIIMREDDESSEVKRNVEDKKDKAINESLDIPETSYLEEKYKDYL